MVAEAESYEYRTVAVDPARKAFLTGTVRGDRLLNELAADGWEIVSTAGASQGFFLFGIGQLMPVQIVLLRRPVGAARSDRR
jgi:hypothetical protein